jgi:NitT/TauT family transport system substrate-binding protein
MLQGRRAFVGTLTSLVGAAAFPKRAVAQVSSKIRILEVAVDLYGLGYYAEDGGFFKKAGLDVDINTLAGGSAVLSAVLGGAAEIGISSVVALANAVTRGVPVTILSGSGLCTTQEPSYALCVSKTSSLASAKDLVGKTVAVVSLNDSATVATFTLLDKAGIDRSKLHIFELPFPEMGAALQAGRVDAAVISEPALNVALKTQVRSIGNPFNAIGSPVTVGAFFSTPEWIRSNPAQARKFVSAMADAARWSNTHRRETAAILAKYSKLDLSTAQSMTRCPQAEKLTVQMVQPMLDAAFTQKLLSRRVDATELMTPVA